jgi:hypothetical protein
MDNKEWETKKEEGLKQVTSTKPLLKEIDICEYYKTISKDKHLIIMNVPSEHLLDANILFLRNDPIEIAEQKIINYCKEKLGITIKDEAHFMEIVMMDTLIIEHASFQDMKDHIWYLYHLKTHGEGICYAQAWSNGHFVDENC